MSFGSQDLVLIFLQHVSPSSTKFFNDLIAKLFTVCRTDFRNEFLRNIRWDSAIRLPCCFLGVVFSIVKFSSHLYIYINSRVLQLFLKRGSRAVLSACQNNRLAVKFAGSMFRFSLFVWSAVYFQKFHRLLVDFVKQLDALALMALAQAVCLV